jgi:hypothetical protein
VSFLSNNLSASVGFVGSSKCVRSMRITSCLMLCSGQQQRLPSLGHGQRKIIGLRRTHHSPAIAGHTTRILTMRSKQIQLHRLPSTMLRLYPIGEDDAVLLVTHSPLLASSTIDGVFTVSDLVVGVGIAVALATFVTVLDQRRQPPPPRRDDEQLALSNTTQTSSYNASSSSLVLFEAWDEMQRPDNYIWYKTANVRNKDNRQRRQQQQTTANLQRPLTTTTTERRWVVVALVALFAPIFTFELFLTVSRQMLCEGPFDHMEWARYLCSPVSYHP